MDTDITATLVDEFVEQILELSADAQVHRRAVTKDSLEFHTLTGAIAAYGKVLTLVTALRRVGKLYANAGEHTPDYQHKVS